MEPDREFSETLASNADGVVPDNRDPLRRTDLGNAERFALQHASRARFSAGMWFVWDGRRWKRDDTESVRRLARKTVASLYAEASELDDATNRKRLAAHATRSESSRAISAMLREAQAFERISIPETDLDSPKTRYLLTCLNGTLDVRTGEIGSFNPHHLITRLAPVDFSLEAHSDLWETFLDRIVPDPDTRAFLQRYIGSALTGDTADQSFVIMHGSGANGKSTFVATILSMLGDYGQQANFETFLAADARKAASRGGARPDLVNLKGARFVAAVEAGSGRRLDETTLKALTGGDLITTRQLYQGETTFQPECKIALVANHRPEIWGADHAIWRRVLEVPFTVTIPETDRDSTLRDRLSEPEHLSAVLAWAVLGCMDWWEKHPNRLDPPDAVSVATQSYRDDENALGPFLDDCTSIDPNATVSTGELWKSYLGYCENEKITSVGRKTFFRLVEDHGFTPFRTNKARMFKGLRLTNDIF